MDPSTQIGNPVIEQQLRSHPVQKTSSWNETGVSQDSQDQLLSGIRELKKINSAHKLTLFDKLIEYLLRNF